MRNFLIGGSHLMGLVAWLCLPLYATSQTWTPRAGSSLCGSTGGYYEYLPAGYDPAKKYPTIIFFHGAGEVGNGSSQLSLVLTNELPKMINEGRFPVSVNLSGVNYAFIVLAPQFYHNPSPADIDALITNVGNNYAAVDQSRIYLTGLSMGGGAIWEYVGASSSHSSRPAAIVPICGSSWADNQRINNIVSGNLPVLASHNSGDPAVSVGTTLGYVDGINALSPTVPAVKVIFPGDYHNAWNDTYDPGRVLTNNLNFYQWLVSNQRNLVLPVGILNFEGAKELRSINLRWSTSQETKSGYFTIERSEDGRSFTVIGKVQAAGSSNAERRYTYIDQDLPNVPDVYYRLKQTDLDGREQLFKTLKLSLAASAGGYRLFPTIANNNITLEFEAGQSSAATVKLINFNGKQLGLYNIPNRQQRTNIDVSHLSKGGYFLQISKDEKTTVEKFIKQ